MCDFLLQAVELHSANVQQGQIEAGEALSAGLEALHALMSRAGGLEAVLRVKHFVRW